MIKNAIEFGGGGGTLFQPLAVIFLLLGILAWWCFPRKYALWGVALPVVFIHMSQRINLGGMNFFPLRIMVLVGIIEVVARGRKLVLSSPIERAWLWYSLSGALVFGLLWMSFAAFLNRLGVVYTEVGAYIVVRSVITDKQDVDRAIKLFAVVCIALALLMSVERASGFNTLSVFGAEQPEVREGSMRARASFGHPVLAGTFGATLFPLFIGSIGRKESSKLLNSLAAVAATTMVVVSGSSTPALAYLAGIIALFTWGLRRHTRKIRWFALLTLLVLQIVMKAPVWALIFKVSIVTGGSGFHRFNLVDNAIRHFPDWWLLGTKDFGMWGYDTWDTANHYVATAVTGGLITLIAFIVLLRRTFVALAAVRARVAGHRSTEWQVWTFTSALFAHAVAFFGISYFDQTLLLWIVFLAMVEALKNDSRFTGIASESSTQSLPNDTVATHAFQPMQPIVSRF